MRLHVTTANGKSQVSDADTGKTLDWVQSCEVILDPNGPPWLYLGTSAFDMTAAIQTPAPPTPPTLTLTPPAPQALTNLSPDVPAPKGMTS